MLEIMTRAEWDAAPTDFYPPWSVATVRERMWKVGIEVAALSACFVLGVAAFEVASRAIDASHRRDVPSCSDAAHSVARCR